MSLLRFKSLNGRLTQAILALLGASILIWVIMPLAPGNPARRILQAQGIVEPTDLEIEEMHELLHLDKPLWNRYLIWLSNVMRGDFGLSWQTGEPVRQEFFKRLPATLKLACTSFLLAALLAIPSGLLAAKWHKRWPDTILRILSLFGAAVPSFVIALLFIHFMIIALGWGEVILDGNMNQVWIPALVLAIDIVATWSRLLRASLLETKGQPFILSAATRGASENRILLRHAFPNASIPLLHAMGMTLGSLLGGTVIIETIFTWPGLGRYVIEAITARDLPIIQAYAFFSTICFVAMSFLVDVVSWLIDPRIGHRWK